MGAAMKPDLLADERPAGPQIVDNSAGARSTGPFDEGVSYAAYAGRTPDYVLGTDWKKMTTPAPMTAAPPLPREIKLAAAPSEGRDDDDAYAPPPLAAGDAYDDASRAEKTPVAYTPDLDDEAPPESTGDTRRAP